MCCFPVGCRVSRRLGRRGDAGGSVLSCFGPPCDLLAPLGQWTPGFRLGPRGYRGPRASRWQHGTADGSRSAPACEPVPRDKCSSQLCCCRAMLHRLTLCIDVRQKIWGERSVHRAESPSFNRHRFSSSCNLRIACLRS